ncbi:MAG: helix-turn-helix domain-containing protein [Candidatus Cybelea sp.]
MEREGRGPISPDFGTLLRRYRLEAGFSQEALAERARLSLNGISALERGYRRTPQRETVELLAGALTLDAEQRSAFEAAVSRMALPRRRGEAAVTVGPWPSAGSESLPVALARFVGRGAELNEIAALLAEHRLVTLTGAGGIGKTQTALRAARAVSEAGNTAVCFIGLATINAPSHVATAVANALGVQEVPNHPLLETLLAFLMNKSILLVLDNCEHVIAEAAAVVGALLHACADVRILATSREPLRAAGERAYRLPSLDDGDATDLFVDRAQASDTRFKLTDENTPAVREICRRLSGIPLAIELAAPRVTVLPIKALAQELSDRFSILTGGERTALPRQQTMRAVVEWSYELLTAPEQRLFERLSVFVGAFTLEVAERVCAVDGIAESDVLNLLSRLVDKSLVLADVEEHEPRFQLLEPFREYARAVLVSRREERSFAHRHARAFLESAESFERCEHWIREERRHRAGPDPSNYRVAVQWALFSGNDIDLGQRLASVLGTWGAWLETERRQWIAAALELVDDRTPIEVQAALHLAEAWVAEPLMLYQELLTKSRKSLKYYRRLRDVPGLVQSLSFCAHALFYLGQTVEAQQLLGEALSLGSQLGGSDRRYLAYALRLAARAASSDAAMARRYIATAIDIYNEFGQRSGAVFARLDLAACEFRAGDAKLALCHAQAVFAEPPPKQRISACYVLNEMSLYLCALKRYDEAALRAGEALSFARERQFDILVVYALENLAAVVVLRELGKTSGIRDRAASAGRLLGYVDARLEVLGSPREPNLRPRYERVLDLLREALGTQLVVQLMAEGALITEEQAVQNALYSG